MQALTFQGKRSVRVDPVPDPGLRAPTDVLIKVRLAGICGSDLHVYHEREKGLDLGTVMGHEYVGEIVEAGPEVGGLRRGQRVLGPFTTSCGRCFYCRQGLTARCTAGQLFGWVQAGCGLEGAQAEYVRVPLAETTLEPVPEEITDEVALLLGDVLATGYFCARMAGVRPGGVYAVLGCGPVGLMAVVGARELGGREVFAVDTVPERLSLAERLGARPVDAGTQNPVEVLREATDGRGADAVLEAVGSPSASRSAVDLVRPGGTIAVVGVHNEAQFPFSPTEAYDKNLTYRVGRCSVRPLLDELIPLAKSGRYDLASIISHRLPLARGAEGYAMFDGKTDGCTKAVLLPSG